MKKQGSFIYIFLLCPFFCNGQSSFSEFSEETSVLFDSLDNGLHYILHPTTDSNTVCRLVLNIGSLQEENNEKGYAHFLEHMLFNGSEDFPDRKAIDTLQAMGYRYGRDINAYTTYERTVYELSLWEPSQISLALSIFSNFLSKATLTDKDIAKEKKIVIQEIKDFGQENPFNLKKLEGTPYTHRLPIAKERDILELDNERLRLFYQKWYSPSMATIIVTGNVDPEKVAKNIHAHFGNKPRSLHLTNRQHNIRSFHPKFSNHFLANPDTTASYNTLEVIRFSSAPLIHNRETYRQQLTENLYQMLLRTKLKEATSKANYHSIWYLSNRNENTFELQAQSRTALLEQLTLLSSVLSTLEHTEISQKELSDLKGKLLKHTHTMTPESADYIADSYVDQVAVGSPYLSPDAKRSLAHEILPEITSKDVQSLHRSTWSNQGKNLYLFRYNPKLFTLENEKPLEKSWKKGRKNRVHFTKIEKSTQDFYQTDTLFSWEQLPSIPLAPKNTAIVKEVDYENIGVKEITLRNGFRIAIKPTQSKDSLVMLSFVIKNGLNLIPIEDQSYYQDASYFVDRAWINGVNNEAFLNIGAQREISTLIHIDKRNTLINTSNQLANIDDLFEWTYRKLYDYTMPQQEFDEYVQESIENISSSPLSNSSFLNNPTIQMRHKIAQYKSSGYSDVQTLQTAEAWSSVNLHKLFDLFDSLVHQPEQSYIILIGNFDVDEVKEKAVRYFSAIQSLTPANPMWNSDTVQQKATVHKEVITNPANLRTDVTLIFPGNIRPTLKETVSAHIVRELLQSEFIRESREKNGLVYSPYADIEIQLDHPTPQTFTTLHFSTDYESVKVLEDMTKRLLRKLQTETISETLLRGLQRTIANNKTRYLTEENPYNWAQKLGELYLNFNSLEDFNQYESILRSICPEDIMRVAKTMFSEEHYGLFIVTPFSHKPHTVP